MIKPYYHQALNDWLDNTVTDEFQDTVNNTLTLLVNHYRSEDSVNYTINDFLDRLENVDSPSTVPKLYAFLQSSLITVLAEYGIVIETDQLNGTSHLTNLNQFLYTVLEITDYEDVLAVDSLLSLGNSNTEIFSELVHLYFPDSKVSDDMLLLNRVDTNLLHRIKDIIKSEVEAAKVKLESLNISELTRVNEWAVNYFTTVDKLAKVDGYDYPPDKAKASEALINFINLVTNDLEKEEYYDLIYNTTISLIELLQINHTQGFTVTSIYLMKIIKELHQEFDIMDAVNNIPEDSHYIRNINMKFEYTQQVRKLLLGESNE